ncbi:MAG: NAD(P)-dependent oxidoreductase [Ignavibacteriae bacterium]|nr:NAD(P)-dependent oxidoreductase [Ignavibacteriota bacterium]
MKPTIGFIGLGVMGLPMATRLQNAGYALRVYNRTKEKTQSLVNKGAEWCESPAVVAEISDIVISMLSTSEVLKEIATGPSGVLSKLGKGKVHIDMSTVAPAVTGELDKAYASAGRYFLHSPVLGSIPQATDGSLLLFVGGNDTAYKQTEDILKVLGKQVWRFERVDQASHTKLLCNLFIAGMITTLAQALVFARKTGVNPRILLEIIGQSALNSPMYQSKGASIIDGNFTPRFFLEHMLKDINLMLDAAREAGAPLPAIEAAQELFAQASQKGLGKEDYSAVVKVIDR